MVPSRLGITTVGFWSPNKRDAPFFDQISVNALEKELSNVVDPAVRADWEFLASQDYVVEYAGDIEDDRKGELFLGGQRVAEIDLDKEQSFDQLLGIAALTAIAAALYPDRIPRPAELLALTPELKLGLATNSSELAEKAGQLLRQIHQVFSGKGGVEEAARFLEPLIYKAQARMVASVLSNVPRLTAIPIMPNEFGMEHMLLKRTAVGDVTNMVITSLPEVDELTPWQDVLDFRREEQTREQLDRFGRWTRNAVRRLTAEKITAKELEDEFASMLDSYREHMRLHKMKTKRSAAQIVITSAVGVVEDLVKVRFKSIAESLFKLEHNRVALLEAELKAPGREIAYIVSAHERFR